MRSLRSGEGEKRGGEGEERGETEKRDGRKGLQKTRDGVRLSSFVCVLTAVTKCLKQLEGEILYFGSWFQRSRLTVTWLHASTLP